MTNGQVVYNCEHKVKKYEHKVNSRMATEKVVYFGDVAKRLDIQPHKCSQRFFVGNKSQRHRLRAFSLNNEKDKKYLCRVFSLHPQVARSTQKPIDERIKSAMGGVSFEMCNNLWNRIEKQLKVKIFFSVQVPLQRSLATTTVLLQAQPTTILVPAAT